MLAGFQRAFEGGLLTGGQAFESLVQTVQHGAGTELVAHALLGIHGLAVDLGVEVDIRVIALRSRTINADQRSETLTQGIKTLGDVFVGDGGSRHVDGHAVELRKLNVRAALHGRGELELGVVLGGSRDVLHIKLRLGHRADLLLFEGLGVQLRHALVDGFAGDGTETDAGVDDLAGHVALAEAGDVDLLADFLAGFVEIRVELFWIDGDGELHLGRLEVPNADFHACAPD